jgi:hypothetical protein
MCMCMCMWCTLDRLMRTIAQTSPRRSVRLAPQPATRWRPDGSRSWPYARRLHLQRVSVRVSGGVREWARVACPGGRDTRGRPVLRSAAGDRGRAPVPHTAPPRAPQHLPLPLLLPLLLLPLLPLLPLLLLPLLGRGPRAVPCPRPATATAAACAGRGAASSAACPAARGASEPDSPPPHCCTPSLRLLRHCCTPSLRLLLCSHSSGRRARRAAERASERSSCHRTTALLHYCTTHYSLLTTHYSLLTTALHCPLARESLEERARVWQSRKSEEWRRYPTPPTMNSPTHSLTHSLTHFFLAKKRCGSAEDEM